MKMKTVVIIILFSVLAVGCASLKSMKSKGCQGKFTPINDGRYSGLANG